MKKVLSAFAICALLASAACAPAASNSGSGDTENAEVEISLWTYPVGGWESVSSVAPFLTAFHIAHPEIRVSMTSVDYTTGDSELEAAIGRGEAPDLVLEGPERLVANWGARGLMADLNDLWEEPFSAGVYKNVAEACHDGNGNYYIYPLCMTTHCMAINRDIFEAADAWKYIDEEAHTWTTENFVKAVGAIRDYYRENGIEKDVAVIYCGEQGGDQGTRALVNNLYGGTFTDAKHTVYTVNSPENIQALQLLQGLDGVRFDPSMVGSDEITAFCAEELAIGFCWNVSAEIKQIVNHPDRTFEIFPMAFPTNGNKPSLQGGIWGFGIFDNGDEKRIEAAKEFIRFLNGENYAGAVTTSSYLPVRELERNPYENDELMEEYGYFSRYMGDYYQITPGWTKARAAWWKLLQSVGRGEDVAEAVKQFPVSFSQ